ncbi:MAG: LytTR family transcriptional regulator DNA-binding domain-containing protein [Hyphomonadaceae bacterium]|nr:MAG: LytTr DNA-binding domain-containing protein [Caulobacteraceae bacterium]MBT9444361.1 LytTR family transcriptional regulator DNA-binding domain-containing protein [Hyphomonadaceae bacterium]TPW06476.1 MAG: LytTr DNA-binding domain-containing protein [Alphaproteobacteria bacterium]
MREPTEKSRKPHGFAADASRTVAALAQAHGRTATIAIGAGVFMAVVGAFGFAGAPLWLRLAYWIGVLLAGSVVGAVVSKPISQRPKIGEKPFRLWALITLLISAPMTLIVWSATTFAFRRPFVIGEGPYFFGAVMIVSAAMTAINMAANRPGPATHAPSPGAPASKIRFLERLPPKLMGAAIHAVEAEDHYLRLHTSKGSDLILMRLADAIVELEGLEGAQVHRSWWVARDAVTEVRRDGARVSLILPGGGEAPVSRPNVKALREAGWI